MQLHYNIHCNDSVPSAFTTKTWLKKNVKGLVFFFKRKLQSKKEVCKNSRILLLKEPQSSEALD